jgi:TP901 family phage tail tape measure protein
MADNQVTLTINLDSSDAQKNLSGFVTKSKDSFSKVQTSIIALNQGFQLLGKGIRAMGGVFDKTVGQAITLQKNVAEITTLLGDQEDATKSLTDEILKLQSRYGTDQVQLTKAYYSAISSGAVDASSAMGLIDAATKLAIGGATDLDTAVDGLTTVMNAFGKDVKASKKISDAFFIGMKAGKTTVGELSSSIGQAAGLAATMNVSFEELIASTSALTTGGVQTSVAVTQIRAAMVGLARQTPALTDVLNKLNIKNIQAAIKSEGFVKVLKKIRGQTDGTASGLTELFGSVEAVNAIIGLTSDTIGGKFNDIMSDMANIAKSEGKTTEEAYAKMAGTIDQKLAILSGKVNSYFTRIGLVIGKSVLPIIDSISPAIDELAGDFISLAGYLGKVYDGLKSLDIDKLETTLYSAATAVGIFAASWAVLNFSTITTSIVGLGIAMATYAKAAASGAAATLAAVAPYIAIAAAIAGVIVGIDLLIANWSQFSKLIASASPYIGNLITKYMAEGFALVYDGIVAVVSGLNKLGIVSDATFSGMKSDQQDLYATINEANNSQKESLEALKKAYEETKFSGGSIGKVISEMSSVMKIFGDNVDKTTAKIAKQASQVNNLKTVAGDEINIKINTELSKDTGGIGAFVSNLRTSVSGAIDSILQNDFVKGVAKVINNASGSGTETEEEKKEKEKEDPNAEVKDAAVNVMSSIGSGLNSLMGTFSSGASATRASLDQIEEIDKRILAQWSAVEQAKVAVATAGSEEEKKAAIEKLKEEKDVSKQLIKDKEKAEEESQKVAEDSAVSVAAKGIGGVVGIFSEGAGAFIGSLIELAKDPEALVAFVKNLIDQLPAIIDGLVAALPQIIDAILDALPTIIESIIEALPFIVETLAENLPRLIVILAQGVIKLIAKLPAILLGLIRGLFKGIGGQIGGDFKANFTQLFDKFKELNKKLVEAPTKFAVDMTKKTAAAFKSFFDKFKQLNEKLTKAPTMFVAKLLQGAVDFIKTLVEKIKGALPKIGGGGGGTLGQIKSKLKFADGGVVPQGFPNDTFPASLTSGEVVLNKDQQDALGINFNSNQQVLSAILSAVNSPVQVNTKLYLNETAFADIILDLNKDNRRLA